MRRLATLAATAIFALGFSVTPALAGGHTDGHGDHWVVVARTSTDLSYAAGSDMGGMLDCSTAHHASSYTIVSGFVDQVEMYKGKLDSSGVARGPGEAVETWTLRDVKVRSDQTGRIYQAVGSSRIDFTWNKGATYQVGPFTSGSFVQDIQVKGTRDGRSFTQIGVTWPMAIVSDHGTCSSLQVGMN